MKSAAIFLLSATLLFVPGCSDDDDNSPNGNGGSATVSGTLTLPAPAAGMIYYVAVDDDATGDNGDVTSTTGSCPAGTSVPYMIENVPSGTYYVYAVVWVVGTASEPPVAGDYYGFYGTGASVPSAANATVPESGEVTRNITLSVMGE